MDFGADSLWDVRRINELGLVLRVGANLSQIERVKETGRI